MLTEDISKTDQSLDADTPGFDPAPTNLSTEALNGTNPVYDESPTELKTKKNVSKLTVVVDPRGLTCQAVSLLNILILKFESPFSAFGEMTVSPSDEEASSETESAVEHPNSPKSQVTNVSQVDEGKDDIVGGGEEIGETVEAVDDVDDASSPVGASGGGGGGGAEGGWSNDEEYIVEYSLEYGFLRLSPGMDSLVKFS